MMIQALLIHTSTDVANLICSFIKYSSYHDKCNGIKNAFDNKTTEHCPLCNNCEGCDECEPYVQDYYNYNNYNNCNYCHVYRLGIKIPIVMVIIDWELFFRDTIKLNKLDESERWRNLPYDCDCNVIPNFIQLVRDDNQVLYTCKFHVVVDCPICTYYSHIEVLNIIYDDGSVHIALNCVDGKNLILSII